MTTEAMLLTPNDGEKFVFPAFTITARVLSAQTGGAFELWELEIGAASVDYHVHNRMDETLCVIEGEVEFNVQGETYTRPAGSVAFIPRGLHHGFTNHGPARARLLIFFTPSTRQDAFFAQLARLLAAPTPDADAITALQKQYDQELIAPST